MVDARRLAGPLLRWFDGAKREMPWRGVRDAYAIWVSETMLQQTQVATVVPYYRRFLERFPTVGALAAARLEEVLGLWAGLGYYRRAKHLHMAAQKVVKEFGGKVPGTVEELRTLPGVGRYTAGAVASMAYGVSAPVVDGNVMRVLARVFGYEKDIGVAGNQGFFWETAGEILLGAGRTKHDTKYTKTHEEEFRFGDVNQAMMELGAVVCVPAGPACGECPLRRVCVAHREGREAELPVKGAKKAVATVRRVVLVLLDGRGRVLVMRRPGGGLWEQLWEFPTFAEGTREMGKELGVKVERVKGGGVVEHQLTHRRMRYEVVTGRVRGEGRKGVKLPACDRGGRYEEARWVAWPLEKGAGGGGPGGLPMARVVHKIAAVVESCGEMADKGGNLH